MAALHTITGLLETLAGNYNKRQGWAETVRPTWERAFRQTDDRDLARAVSQLLGESEYCPTIAKVNTALKESRSSGAPRRDEPGCGKCAGGWREVVRHKLCDDKRVEVERVAARCECRAGVVLAQPIGTATNQMEVWSRSASTIAGPWLDPDPATARTPEMRKRIAGSVGRWDVNALLLGPRKDPHQRERERIRQRAEEAEAEAFDGYDEDRQSWASDEG